MENIDTPSEAEYGAEIAVDGMPAWLRDDENVMGAWGDVWFFGGATLVRHYAAPESITAIRLPADHWAYPVIAAGFEPWGGGDEAPEDAGEVMFRNGITRRNISYNFAWGKPNSPAWEIIGYKRKVAPGSEVWAASVEYEPGNVVRVEVPEFKVGDYVVATESNTYGMGVEPGDVFVIERRRGNYIDITDKEGSLRTHLIEYYRSATPAEIAAYLASNTPTPTDTVTIPMMTEEDAQERASAYSDQWLSDELKTVRDVIMAVYTDLGLIRPTTLLDQFEAHHGGLDDNQRAIIEIYQEWVAGL